MTHITKLFLTLSLLVMQSAFGMEQATKKARTDNPDKGTLVNIEQDLVPWVDTFMVIDELGGPRPYFVRLFQPIYSYNQDDPDDNNRDHSLYEGIDCTGYNDWLSSNLQMDRSDLPWKVRGLKRAEVSTLMLGRDYGDDVPGVPNEVRLRDLEPSEQTRWVVDDHLKFPVALLAMKKFRHSALDPVPKDVVRLICKLKIADVRRENPVLRSIE